VNVAHNVSFNAKIGDEFGSSASAGPDRVPPTLDNSQTTRNRAKPLSRHHVGPAPLPENALMSEMNVNPLTDERTGEKPPWRARSLFRFASLVHRARHYLVQALMTDRDWLRRTLGSIMGLVLAAAILLYAPGSMFVQSDWNVAEVHIASAGIIGTALALVLTLSIVPAQKAADVFSAAILRLYARDWRVVLVFAVLAAFTLVSLLLGTNWAAQGSAARWCLAFQFVLLGLALDALRAFYDGMLDLLVPSTALRFVSRECEKLMRSERRQIESWARILKLLASSQQDEQQYRWMGYNLSRGQTQLNAWNAQLEEFAHKAIARRDTQAAKEITLTMMSLGLRYAASRRDTMVLAVDFSGLMPLQVSDVSNVLSPIYESVHNICGDAVRHGNEAVAISCIRGLGYAANSAVTTLIVEDQGLKRAPLAFSAVHFIGMCAELTGDTSMDDARLAAIRALNELFRRMPADVHQPEVKSAAIEFLFKIARRGSLKPSGIVNFAAVEAMLVAAQKDLRDHGSDTSSDCRTVLGNLVYLLPGEVSMEQAGERVLQTFPAYRLGFAANVPALLRAVISRLQPIDAARSRVDPFAEIVDVTELLVDHYREIGAKIKFNGVLLQKWVLESITDSILLLVGVVKEPPPEGEEHLKSLDDQIKGLVYVCAFYFAKDSQSVRYVTETCDALADIGMRLLELGRTEPAGACVDIIAKIATYFCRDPDALWPVVQMTVSLEIVARAAEALGYFEVVQRSRTAMKVRDTRNKPKASIDDVRRYQSAMASRMRQLDARLAKSDDRFPMRKDPIPTLLRILAASEARAH
jgi:hypothetical protein